jgi:crotonobetainyl-CoA:carnitine CoA-transferase CaiB-like acyl-CoA transferase
MADPVFKRLLHAMKQDSSAIDPRFIDARARAANESVLDELIASWTSNLTLMEAEAALSAAEVPATRIFTMKDIFADPHFRARDMLVDIPHDTLGSVKVAGIVPKLSDTPGTLHHAGGAIGRDTREVLAGLGGYSEEEINELIRENIIRSSIEPPVAAHAGSSDA